MTSITSLSRRSALLLPLAAGGCSLFDNLFGDTKTPLSGTREPVSVATRGLTVDNPATRPVTLPPAIANQAWPQAGGEVAHAPGNLAAGPTLTQAWRAGIGEGGGYRAKITARPVVAGGHVFAMDSDAVVSAYDLASGAQLWRSPSAAEEDRSTNIGGGIAYDGEMLYAATGRAELVAIAAADGKVAWRKTLPTPARA